ncbi:uncharacterized protein MYCFIDRAFT_34089 [Pseudocercospora fijiensis CIRAD86]|uniref:Signal recognition particle receptor subunit beta n=1 Tax=Pseudocercospora fijiensis (strain CIRAD86) TaxID=383855 RepID=M2ZK21_PSEFD|nr:uncharacterized protein MYCFIDRAFT_34089 [Pseudocercospora fijiensis CIRAD86]EME79454.1 hypothetical protein MYCFIDRAFT_34089 [Pseudocercospora fijiensis CIRAD86]
MAKHGALEEWATWLFSPTWSAMLFAVVVAIALPLIFHWALYRKTAAKELASFLLVGPSGSGKTSLFTLLANGSTATTHTSQEPQDAICQLPSKIRSSEDKYRSENDNAPRSQPKFQLVDTPGHGKLRHHALSSVTASSALKGLLFVVDSAAISSAAGLAEAAEFLHDILLVLQKRHTQSRSSKGPESMPVLVAANKQDVFTSLPTAMVKTKLEEEIAKVRQSKSKGVIDSGIDVDDNPVGDDEQNWLGEFGAGDFRFSQMEEHGIDVKVMGGNVKGEGDQAGHIDGWWVWIGENI